MRTLLDTDNQPERRTALIAHELQRYKIDIAAITESRFSDEGSLTERGEGYTFFWRGVAENQPRIHGVAFAIRTALLHQIPTTNERLMQWRIPLTNSRYLSIINAYAPTLPSDENIKDQFYAYLHSTLQAVPREDKLILLGDFNARVGSDHHLWEKTLGRHGIGSCNANGLRLLSLCSTHELAITNTMFQLREMHKTTWMHPRSKRWHLLDYVITRQSDLKDVKLTRAMRGADGELTTGLFDHASTLKFVHQLAVVHHLPASTLKPYKMLIPALNYKRS